MVKTSESLPAVPGRKKKDDKSSVVEEKSTRPPGQSRFTRKRLDDSSSIVSTVVVDAFSKTNEVTELTSEADFCQNLLIGGYVQSYVDFYHLTHRADPNAQEGSVHSKIQVSVEDMIFIRNSLVLAEVSRRQGKTDGVYSSYNKLADYYVNISDWRTSIYFHEKCLEVAKLTQVSYDDIFHLYLLRHNLKETVLDIGIIKQIN